MDHRMIVKMAVQFCQTQSSQARSIIKKKKPIGEGKEAGSKGRPVGRKVAYEVAHNVVGGVRLAEGGIRGVRVW